MFLAKLKKKMKYKIINSLLQFINHKFYAKYYQGIKN